MAWPFSALLPAEFLNVIYLNIFVINLLLRNQLNISMDKKKKGATKIMSILTAFGILIAIVADSFSAFDGIKAFFGEGKENTLKKSALLIGNPQVRKNDLLLICSSCNILTNNILQCPIEIQNKRRYPNLSICAKGEWGSFIKLIDGSSIEANQFTIDQSEINYCLQRKIQPSSVLKIQMQFNINEINIQNITSVNIGTSIGNFVFKL